MQKATTLSKKPAAASDISGWGITIVSYRNENIPCMKSDSSDEFDALSNDGGEIAVDEKWWCPFYQTMAFLMTGMAYSGDKVQQSADSFAGEIRYCNKQGSKGQPLCTHHHETPACRILVTGSALSTYDLR